MMKRILYTLVALLMCGQLFGQPGREEVLLTREQRQRIAITPEMAKGLLLWAEVKNTDSSLVYMSNRMCYGIDCDEMDDEIFYFSFDDSLHCSEGVYYDREGNAVLKGSWGAAADFTNGYAIVTDMDPQAGYDSPRWAMLNAEHYGLINRRGKFTIPFKKFDGIFYGVHEGLVTVSKNGKWGFATPEGVVKVKLQYEEARRFSEGLAAVKKDGLWGYIDKQGKVVIPFGYAAAYEFRHGVAVVKGNYGFTDLRNHGVTDLRNYGVADSRSGFVCGLVDRDGRSTFDYYEGMGMKEYQGAYQDEEQGRGEVRYSYYENGEGQRVKHGYHIFATTDYYEDGHYLDGEKEGLWVYRWGGGAQTAFNHDFSGDDNTVGIQYDKGRPTGTYLNYSSTDGFFGLYGICREGRPVDTLHFYGGGPMDVPLDPEGNVHGDITLQDNGSTGNIPFSLTLTFYKGVPMQVVQYDHSTGQRDTSLLYEQFESVDSIYDTLVAGGLHLYRMGEGYFILEPKDPETPYDIVDIESYVDEIARPLTFLLDLPQTWPLEEVGSPKLNFFRYASWNDLKPVYYSRYRQYFVSDNDFESAFSRGEDSFLFIVKKNQAEMKRKAYERHKRFFCGSDDFGAAYDRGTAAFDAELVLRDSLYTDYQAHSQWFKDFCDYHAVYTRGVSTADERERRSGLYEENKEYFVYVADFLNFYLKGRDSLNAEIVQRRELVENSVDPFTGRPLFRDTKEMLNCHLGGTALKEMERRKRAIRDSVQAAYGQLFASDDEFNMVYRQGEAAFMRAAALRLFNSHVAQFVDLKLKEALSSSKEKVRNYLAVFNHCVELSPEVYPELVGIMVRANERLADEWEDNGRWFESEVEFYEAYVSENYKKILKEKKK